MGYAVHDLMVYLHKFAARCGYLSDLCKDKLPTGCQMMIYYALFGGSVGRHRDNWCTADFERWLAGDQDVLSKVEGHSASSDTNSQVVGSDVMIWTPPGSTPMSLKLSFPDRRFPGAERAHTFNPVLGD